MKEKNNILIILFVESGINAKDVYYENPLSWDDAKTPVVSPNPNMMELTRGISWSVSNYLRHQIGCIFNMTCDFVDENIYAGYRGNTVLNEEVLLNMKKQHPSTKFTISPNIPLSNRLNIQDTTTIGFFTKRILRSHLGGIFKEFRNKEKKRLQKNQLRLKSVRYPIQVTIQVVASN